MSAILNITDLRKTYDGGFEALKGVSLDINEGEILALLGPNGAGKTTLISAVCGIITPTSGQVTVAGHDIDRDFRAARRLIGLVPQEVALEPFETVWNSTCLSRGLFGCPRNDARIEDILRKLSLWDKKDAQVKELSGGMKRRVLIAKALSHEPSILFLDEPTAGVDVELRKGMWRAVHRLKEQGVTIILTTHYIEEAEEMADRVAIIDKGRILVVDETASLMRRLGKKRLTIDLVEPLAALPETLTPFELTLEQGGARLSCAYDAQATPDAVQNLMTALIAAGVSFRDIETEQSSLEEVFVGLVKHNGEDASEPAHDVARKEEAGAA